MGKYKKANEKAPAGAGASGVFFSSINRIAG
jgi:hypothetical protein